MKGLPKNPYVADVEKSHPDLARLLELRDGAAKLAMALPQRITPRLAAESKVDQRAWEQVGLFYFMSNRPHEALGIFKGLYRQMLAFQEEANAWTHKGMPLVWMAECFRALGFRVHAKRYLMLTLCEDAITGKGVIPAENNGIYFRLIWQAGFAHGELERYAAQFWELFKRHPAESRFPEFLLQQVGTSWLTELPSQSEALSYVINEHYANWLLGRLGQDRGVSLEVLSEYLLSCMPGCRTRRRQLSNSTEYDVVCSMEGWDFDFRSEFGRYFVCECKDWARTVDFTTVAKFCRVLDSTKARFGILFSRNGVSGQGQTTFGAREVLKVFQDRGIVIVVLDERDLRALASGESLIVLLRERYEAIRLDT